MPESKIFTYQTELTGGEHAGAPSPPATGRR